MLLKETLCFPRTVAIGCLIFNWITRSIVVNSGAALFVYAAIAVTFFLLLLFFVLRICYFTTSAVVVHSVNT